MSGFASTAWWFWIGGGVLALLGFALLLWALFWDRSKGRRRCPRCWYDLGGTPQSLTCSECGRTAKRERKLFKTRRRWRWAALAAVMLFLAGVGVWGGDFAQRGWTAMPTTGLIFLMKNYDDMNPGFRWQRDAMGELSIRCDALKAAQARSRPLWDWQWKLILDEALERVEQPPPLFQAQGNRLGVPRLWTSMVLSALFDGHIHRLGYAERFAAIDPLVLKARCAKSWPLGHEVPIDVALPSAFASMEHVQFTLADGARLEHSSTAPLPYPGQETRWYVRVPEGSHAIDVTVHPVVYSFDRLNRGLKLPPVRSTVSVNVSGPISRYRRGNPSPIIDEVVRNGFSWSLILQDGKPRFSLVMDEQCLVHANEIGDGARILIIHDGRLAASLSGQFEFALAEEGQPQSWTCLIDVPTELLGLTEGTMPDDGKWQMRFMIDVANALYGSAESQYFWTGEVESRIDWTRTKSDVRGESGR